MYISSKISIESQADSTAEIYIARLFALAHVLGKSAHQGGSISHIQESYQLSLIETKKETRVAN